MIENKTPWLLSPDAAKLTPPVAALGLLLTVVGCVAEFAPGILSYAGFAAPPEIINTGLMMIGPVLSLACFRLMLAQAEEATRRE